MNSFGKRLAAESRVWRDGGLISGEQRERILALYPEDHGNHRFLAVLSLIGAALVAVGVSLVISANWHAIGDWTKIGGLLALLLGAYAAGDRLALHPGLYPKTGEACFMLGSVLFLSGIALVSQIFHLNARPATGVMIWWLGIAAVPFITRSRGAQFASLAAFLLWIGMEMATSDSWLRLTVGNDYGEIPFFREVAAFYMLGTAVFLGGIVFRRTAYRSFAGVHEFWGLAIGQATLYALAFLRHSWRYQETFLPARPTVVVLLLVALGALAVFAWRMPDAPFRRLAPWLTVPLIPVLAVLCGWQLHDGGRTWSAMAWISLLAVDIMIIKVGMAEGRESWVLMGLVFIALNIFTRYWDIFGSMLQGGLFFVTTGLVILGLGVFLEWKRRQLLASMKGEK